MRNATLYLIAITFFLLSSTVVSQTDSNPASKSGDNQKSESNQAVIIEPESGNGEDGDTNKDSSQQKDSVKKPEIPKEIADKIAAAKRAGDNAWMMTSAALVLFMAAPGLAMFYGGLVRQKNVLSVMMQCFYLMGMMTIVWAVCGYSFAFGGNGAYFGNFDHVFMNGVALENKTDPSDGAIPGLTFMVFQGMFFIITPALICGAFAERMKFSTMVVFSLVWGLVVYCPLCHWVWHEKGILYFGGENAWAGGAIDFAGGTVVHMSSGISALVIAFMIGKRSGMGTDDMRPHNLTYTAMGAAMLWVGWFGFNAGSAGASSDSAANAFVVTHFSAAAGAFAWATVEWIRQGKPTILGAASGAVAGLVCITPASGCVHPMAAILMGMIAGVLCYMACGVVKKKFGYDDSLDAFGVHGVGGTLGAILIGFFATTDVGDGNGLFYSLKEGTSLLFGQVVAVLVTLCFSVVMTFVLVKILDVLMGLRVDEITERRGLDQGEHGEEGYIFNR